MTPDPRVPRRIPRPVAALLFACGLAAASLASAHGGKAGDVEIDHPYAMPTPSGAVNGAAYIAGMTNGGKSVDRLLKVSTPVAQRTEIHTMALDANGVMRMREVGEIALPPGERIAMKPGMGFHIMLIGLKQPLKEGESIPLTMEFERGGKTEVQIKVESKAGAAAMHQH